MLKKICAGAAVFTAIVMFAGTALGETYYIDDGDITVSQDSTGRYVNGSATAETGETVITQHASGTATAYTVTVTSGEEGAVVEVTLKDVNIEAADAYTKGVQEHDGESAVTVNGSAEITFEGDNKLSGGAGLDVLGSGAGGSETGKGGAGIEVGDGDSLTLNAADEDATLTANGGNYAAGIGSTMGEDAGSVTVEDGTVTANGGYGAAGIGAGQGGNGGSVTIEDGTVTANGGEHGAGIGGGEQIWLEGGNGGEITINGGDVTANGGEYAAGIGSGDNSANYGEEGGMNENVTGGNITINGGDVKAKGGYQGAGIGGGNHGDGGVIIINDGKVYATTTTDEWGYSFGAGIGGGSFADGGTVTIYGGDVTALGGMYSAGVGGGYDGVYGFGHGGIFIIYGGKLYAVGGAYAAAIGGAYLGNGGSITLAGGETHAIAGYGASALGGGFGGLGGDISIYDGNREAQTMLEAYAYGNKWAIDITGDTTGVENVINGRFRGKVPGLDVANKTQLTQLEIVDANGNVISVMMLPLVTISETQILYRAFASTVFSGGSYRVRNSDGLYGNLYTEYDELENGTLAAQRDRVYTVKNDEMLNADDIIFVEPEPEPAVPDDEPSGGDSDGLPLGTPEIPLGTPATGDGGSIVYAILIAGAAVEFIKIARRKQTEE